MKKRLFAVSVAFFSGVSSPAKVLVSTVGPNYVAVEQRLRYAAGNFFQGLTLRVQLIDHRQVPRQGFAQQAFKMQRRQHAAV